MAAHKKMSKGEILAEPGDRNRPMLVVSVGQHRSGATWLERRILIVVHTAGSFTGEMSTLQGIGSLVRSRVRDAGDALGDRRGAIAHRSFKPMPELSELFMRAYILRRVGLIASQSGDVILLGSSHSAGTLRLQQFLTRNSFPYVYLDVNADPGVQNLFERFDISAE